MSTQLPIRASVVGRYDVVVGSDVGIDRLVTDLEDAPDATANGHSPAIVVISLPIRRDEGARRQVPALGEVIVAALSPRRTAVGRLLGGSGE